MIFLVALSISLSMITTRVEVVEVKPQIPIVLTFTEEEIDILNRLCMSEAGNEPFDGKQAVIQTTFNRIKSSKFPNNLKDVLDGQYSLQDNGEPSEECKDAVKWTIEHQNAFPNDMYWFKNGDYFEEVEGKRYDYTKIGNHYFSTERNYNVGDK